MPGGDGRAPHNWLGHITDAVGQAVFLIRPGFVESQSRLKALPGLRNHGDRGIGKNAIHLERGDSTKLRGVAQNRQRLAQHFICRDDLGIAQGAACLEGSGVPLITLVRKCDPVEGIGKDPPHASLRFGVP
jgi:hypothetical protein